VIRFLEIFSAAVDFCLLFINGKVKARPAQGQSIFLINHYKTPLSLSGSPLEGEKTKVNLLNHSNETTDPHQTKVP